MKRQETKGKENTCHFCFKNIDIFFKSILINTHVCMYVCMYVM